MFYLRRASAADVDPQPPASPSRRRRWSPPCSFGGGVLGGGGRSAGSWTSSIRTACSALPTPWPACSSSLSATWSRCPADVLLAVFGAGFCAAGGQTGISVLAADYYPTTGRATGVSWATGVGRWARCWASMLGASCCPPGVNGFNDPSQSWQCRPLSPRRRHARHGPTGNRVVLPQVLNNRQNRREPWASLKGRSLLRDRQGRGVPRIGRQQLAAIHGNGIVRGRRFRTVEGRQWRERHGTTGKHPRRRLATRRPVAPTDELVRCIASC